LIVHHFMFAPEYRWSGAVEYNFRTVDFRPPEGAQTDDRGRALDKPAHHTGRRG
jgi:hypothetical protein